MFDIVRMNMLRNLTRTILTILTLSIVFLLFLLLRSIETSFAGGIDVDNQRLVVTSKFSQISFLPLSQRQQIALVEGVTQTSPIFFIDGFYREPKHSFQKRAVDFNTYFDIYPEIIISEQVRERLHKVKRGVVTSRSLASSFGWQEGDLIIIESHSFPKADGDHHWELEFVGSFQFEGTPLDDQAHQFLINYWYLNDIIFRSGHDKTQLWMIRTKDNYDANIAASAIDAIFENSPVPTRTTTMDELIRTFGRQFGNISYISITILGAVFFSIIFLTGNNLVQSLNDKLHEFALLRAFGFSVLLVASVVVLEAIAYYLLGCTLGVVLAYCVEPYFLSLLGPLVGSFSIDHSTVLAAYAIAICLGVILGSIPAFLSCRKNICEQLRN